MLRPEIVYNLIIFGAASEQLWIVKQTIFVSVSPKLLQDGHFVIVTSAKTSVRHNKTLLPVSWAVTRRVVSGMVSLDKS